MDGGDVQVTYVHDHKCAKQGDVVVVRPALVPDGSAALVVHPLCIESGPCAGSQLRLVHMYRNGQPLHDQDEQNGVGGW
jgi:hypothetical protein